MNLKEEYKELVINHLESINQQFEEELSIVCNLTFAQEVKFLQIEYDSSTFSDKFSVYMFALNSEGNLMGDVYWFMKNKTIVVPANIYDCEKYEEIEPWSTASDILENWLIARWAKSGNTNYPVYLAHHDSYFMRNIKNGTDISWDKIIESVNT
ncbi:MAG: hypothetical protein ACTH7Q_09235 [Pseudoalteromonas sp.]